MSIKDFLFMCCTLAVAMFSGFLVGLLPAIGLLYLQLETLACIAWVGTSIPVAVYVFKALKRILGFKYASEVCDV